MIARDGETLRHAAHEEGLVSDAAAFEGSVWREWEQALAAPFLTAASSRSRPSTCAPHRAHRRASARARASRCAAARILLWRQRLGALAVIAGLAPASTFRRLLAELLDDGRNPIALSDRYR